MKNIDLIISNLIMAEYQTAKIIENLVELQISSKYIFKTRQDVKLLSIYIDKIMQNTRMIKYRGHTAIEIGLVNGNEIIGPLRKFYPNEKRRDNTREVTEITTNTK